MHTTVYRPINLTSKNLLKVKKNVVETHVLWNYVETYQTDITTTDMEKLSFQKASDT